MDNHPQNADVPANVISSVDEDTGELQHVLADEDHDFGEYQEADDKGGYYEFVNPRAVEEAMDGTDYSTFDEAADPVQEEKPAHAPGWVATEAAHHLPGIKESATEDADGALPDLQGVEESQTDDAEADEEEEMDEVGRSMSVEQVDQLVSMRLRQLDREYSETAGRPADSADGPTVEETDPKLRRLAEIRARLAAAKAASAATATMQLAPGADEFPDDYDDLQLQDSKALVETKEAGPVLVLTAEAITSTPSSVADFDPFGTDAQTRRSQAAAQVPPRAVSPLKAETRCTIAQAMSRIKIVPKGPVGPWAERVVSVALAQAQQSRQRAGPSAK